jgi:hypothetical protein
MMFKRFAWALAGGKRRRVPRLKTIYWVGKQAISALLGAWQRRQPRPLHSVVVIVVSSCRRQYV